MANLILLTLLISSKLIYCQEENDTIIETTKILYTESGPVRGIKFNKYGMDLYGFLGIPYAQPPVGKLRFKTMIGLILIFRLLCKLLKEDTNFQIFVTFHEKDFQILPKMNFTLPT